MLMSEQKNNRCLALLPAAGLHYDKLFHELFSLAIMKAGMIPFRIPFRLEASSPKPLPIDVLLHEIANADALFADLSENSLDIWLALGCALALKKPICLISSRLEFSLPLDIQDLEIIPYPATPFPSDYAELEQNIIEQLLAKRPQADPFQQPQAPSSETSAFPSFIPPPDPSSSEDLTSYEVLALTIIDLKASEDGLSPRDLGLEMQVNECAHLTSHAINALKRRKLIKKKSVQVTEGAEHYSSENIFITPSGEEWLIRHGKRKNLHRSHSLTRDRLLINR
jgi:hypothetical protein